MEFPSPNIEYKFYPFAYPKDGGFQPAVRVEVTGSPSETITHVYEMTFGSPGIAEMMARTFAQDMADSYQRSAEKILDNFRKVIGNGNDGITGWTWTRS